MLVERDLPVHKGSLMDFQRDHIVEIHEQENCDNSAAALVLGVERRNIIHIMKQHGIEG